MTGKELKHMPPNATENCDAAFTTAAKHKGSGGTKATKCCELLLRKKRLLMKTTAKIYRICVRSAQMLGSKSKQRKVLRDFAEKFLQSQNSKDLKNYQKVLPFFSKFYLVIILTCLVRYYVGLF